MTPSTSSTSSRAAASLEVAVVMRRRATVGAMQRWQPWRWELADVVAAQSAFGDRPRLLYGDEHEQRWLHPGFSVELFRDDAEGYYLNLTTDSPCWFVMWRLQQREMQLQPDSVAAASLPDDEPIALPQAVSLSYHDAGRWLDSQETVEQVAAPPAVRQWLAAFVAEHFVLEPKRRRRPQSFRALADRFGNPVSISTTKRQRGGGDD